MFPRNLGPLLKFLISEPSHKFQRRKGFRKDGGPLEELEVKASRCDG